MEFSRSLVGVGVIVVVVVNYQSVFFQSVFPKCIFSKFIFPKCIFPKCIFLKCISQNLFFQSVLIQSVFLQILPDLHVFQALRVYSIVFVFFLDVKVYLVYWSVKLSNFSVSVSGPAWSVMERREIINFLKFLKTMSNL